MGAPLSLCSFVVVYAATFLLGMGGMSYRLRVGHTKEGSIRRIEAAMGPLLSPYCCCSMLYISVVVNLPRNWRQIKGAKSQIYRYQCRYKGRQRQYSRSSSNKHSAQLTNLMHTFFRAPKSSEQIQSQWRGLCQINYCLFWIFQYRDKAWCVSRNPILTISIS